MSTPSSKSRSDTSEARWERHRSTISDLYENGMPLRDIVDILRKIGFDAPEHSFKRKLAEWEVGKNISSDEMEKIVQELMRTHREELLGRSTELEFKVGHRTVRLTQVKRYMRRKRMLHGQDEIPTAHASDASIPDESYWAKPAKRATTASHDSRDGADPEKRGTGETLCRRSTEPVGGKRKRGPDSVATSYESDAHTLPEPVVSVNGPNNTTAMSSKFFACPFYKADPVKFSKTLSAAKRFGSCKTGFEGMHRLKYHLRRTHDLSHRACPRCGETFPASSQMHDHNRDVQACTPVANPYEGLIPPELALTVLRKKRVGETQAANWYWIWHLLFPGRSAPLNPYAENLQYDAVEVVANIFRALGQNKAEDMRSSLRVPETTMVVMDTALERVFPTEKTSYPPSVADTTPASHQFHSSIFNVDDSDDPDWDYNRSTTIDSTTVSDNLPMFPTTLPAEEAELTIAWPPVDTMAMFKPFQFEETPLQLEETPFPLPELEDPDLYLQWGKEFDPI